MNEAIKFLIYRSMNDRIQYLDEIREGYSQLFEAIVSFAVIKEDITIVLTDFFEKLDSTAKNIYVKKFRDDFASYRDSYNKEVDAFLSEVFRRWKNYDTLKSVVATNHSELYSLKEIEEFVKAKAKSKLNFDVNICLEDAYSVNGAFKISAEFGGKQVVNEWDNYEIREEHVHDDFFDINIVDFDTIKNNVNGFIKQILVDNSWNHIDGFFDSVFPSVVRGVVPLGCEKIKWLGSVSEFARLFFDLASNTKIEFPFSSHAEDQSNWLFAKQLLQAFDVRKSDGKPVEVNYLRTALDRARDKEAYKR